MAMTSRVELMKKSLISKKQTLLLCKEFLQITQPVGYCDS